MAKKTDQEEVTLDTVKVTFKKNPPLPYGYFKRDEGVISKNDLAKFLEEEIVEVKK